LERDETWLLLLASGASTATGGGKGNHGTIVAQITTRGPRATVGGSNLEEEGNASNPPAPHQSSSESDHVGDESETDDGEEIGLQHQRVAVSLLCSLVLSTHLNAQVQLTPVFS
jgi:hypothetical protein